MGKDPFGRKASAVSTGFLTLFRDARTSLGQRPHYLQKIQRFRRTELVQLGRSGQEGEVGWMTPDSHYEDEDVRERCGSNDCQDTHLERGRRGCKSWEQRPRCKEAREN